MISAASMLVAGLSLSPAAAALGKKTALDGASWGFVAGEPAHGQVHAAGHHGSLPEVVQLASQGEGCGCFVLEAPTWERLLVLLCWFGSATVQASPADVLRDQSSLGLGLEAALTLDFFLSLGPDSLPRVRLRVDLLEPLHSREPPPSATDRTTPSGWPHLPAAGHWQPSLTVPLVQTLPLPSLLSTLADVLSLAHSLARSTLAQEGGRHGADLARGIACLEESAQAEYGAAAEARHGVGRLLDGLRKLHAPLHGHGLDNGQGHHHWGHLRPVGSGEGHAGRPVKMGVLPDGATAITPFALAV